VKITSPFGCSNLSAPITAVIHPLPVVFLGNDTNVVPGATVVLNAGPGFNSYTWSTGATSQSIIVDSAGHGLGIRTIWVAVRDNNYCEGVDTIKINFTNNPGMEESGKMTTVKVVPNPASDRTEVQLEGYPACEITVKVFSMDGRLVHSRMHPVNDGKVLIDVSMLPESSYIISLSSEQLNSVCRLIIQR